MMTHKFAFILTALLLGSPAVAVGQVPVFYDDFDGGQFLAPPVLGGFSGFTNTESSQGFSGLGSGANVVSGNFLYNPTGDNFTNTPSEKSTLLLTGLPAHTGVQLSFLLAIVDTWSGNSGDFFHVDVDQVGVMDETFSNSDASPQSYVPPPGVLIRGGQNLGFEIFADSLYDMGLDAARFGVIPHTASTLQIDFYATGLDRPANESWAIDNVRVALVPEPSELVLMMAVGLSLFAFATNRRTLAKKWCGRL